MVKIEGYVKSSKEIPNVVGNLELKDTANKILKVREIFYSLQGEGGRQGEASIFIRLAYCNKNCWFCDTDWSFGDYKTVREIAEEVIKLSEATDNWIVWTGGEPTLQLTEDIIALFKSIGFRQAIETNGTNPVPAGLDYVVCSPKVKPDKLEKNFPDGLNELRYPYEAAKMPNIKDLPFADHYFVSPLFLGKEHERFELNQDNLNECIEFCKLHPAWKLSVQNHKLWNIR